MRGFFESTMAKIEKNKDFTVDKGFIKRTESFLKNKKKNLLNIFNIFVEKKEKFSLNIIYYDTALKDGGENSDNCTFFQMNTNGTFYGCHNLDLFILVCDKIRKGDKEFILLSSGKSFSKIYKHWSDIEKIRESYIYCKDLKKHLPLMEKFPKLKGVFSDFNDLINKLLSLEKIENKNIASSNLIFFEDYNKIYIKLHYEIIRKYALYKGMIENNYDKEKFLEMIKNEYPYFLEIAKQLFPDKEETIKYFKDNMAPWVKTTEKQFTKIMNSEETTDSFIYNYSLESFYAYNLNYFLRTGNFDAFRILSSHISKFVYSLYDLRKELMEKEKLDKGKLYRVMYLKPEDLNIYETSIGKVVCFPSFTSTSSEDGAFKGREQEGYSKIKFIIEQNNTKNVVSIKSKSKFKKEAENLFVPFSFFKITGFEKKEGTPENPHLIHLTALTSEKPIEEMFYDFIKNETDNLDPEGLDFLILSEDKTKLSFNTKYYTSKQENNKK